MSIPFLIQVGLATTASIRGWGFIPFAILIGLFAFGYMLGASMTWQNVEMLLMVGVAADWLAMGILGFMAFAGRSQDS